MTRQTARAVFITGAGSGMGRAGAELFHARGWRVGAVDRNAEGLSGLRAHLGPERLFTGQVDVTDRSALEAGLARFCADNTGGGLDMMWNNAGIGASGWFEDVPHEAALRVVAINFTAVLTGAYAALPYLRRTPGSLMFSTSSSSATYGMPQLAVYSATKHAVKGLTEALSVEWRRHPDGCRHRRPGAPPGHVPAAAAVERGGNRLGGVPRHGPVPLGPHPGGTAALVRPGQPQVDRPAEGRERRIRPRPHRQTTPGAHRGRSEERL